MGDKNEDEQLAVVLLLLVIAAIAYAFLLRKAPQVLVGTGIGAIGAVVAVAVPSLLGSDLAWCREVGIRLGIAGLIIAGAFFLFEGTIGADRQMRRFGHAWDLDRSVHTLGHFPLAVVPLTAAVALVVAGGLILKAGHK